MWQFVAQENIELNTAWKTSILLLEICSRVWEIEADVIVANILADILTHLTEDAYRLVKDEATSS